MDDILLVAADRQFRSLVYAQLLEEGYQVLALPSLHSALTYLLRGGAPPRLVLLDLHGQSPPATAGQVTDLWQLAGRVPLVLCAGGLHHALLEDEAMPPAEVLRRPFSVEGIVARVEQLLGRPGPRPPASAGC